MIWSSGSGRVISRQSYIYSGNGCYNVCWWVLEQNTDFGGAKLRSVRGHTTSDWLSRAASQPTIPMTLGTVPDD